MGVQRWVRLALELAVIIVLGVVLGASDVDTAVYALVMAGVVVILVGIELVAFNPDEPGMSGEDEPLPLHEAGFVPEERESTTVRRLPAEPVAEPEEDTEEPAVFAGAVDAALADESDTADEEPAEPVFAKPFAEAPEPQPELEPEPSRARAETGAAATAADRSATAGARA